jgi:hypothetical protein
LRFLRLSLALAIFSAARYDEGLAERALATSAEIGDRWRLPLAREIRFRLLQQITSNAGAAEQDLRIVIDIARSQTARRTELPCCDQTRGLLVRPAQARTSSRSAHADQLLVTEGFDTSDPKDAKTDSREVATLRQFVERREPYSRARNGTAALARTAVPPKATRIGPLSAQSRRSNTSRLAADPKAVLHGGGLLPSQPSNKARHFSGNRPSCY